MDRLLAGFSVLILMALAGCEKRAVANIEWDARVQEEIASHITIRDPHKVRSLIPYESITLERGPCHGDCPIYKMTLNRDGSALLIIDHLLPEKAVRYSTTLGLKDYARIAQLVEIARRSVDKPEYFGQWSGGYSVTITVQGEQGSWSITDYGQVAPPEVWALEQAMFGVRSQLLWAGGVK